MKTIRHQLEPHIRAVGIRETIRRVRSAGITGINVATLSQWLTGAPSGRPDSPTRRIKDHQIEAIAAACGVEIIVRNKKRTRKGRAS